MCPTDPKSDKHRQISLFGERERERESETQSIKTLTHTIICPGSVGWSRPRSFDFWHSPLKLAARIWNKKIFHKQWND
jgi:hypothetical protein